jgi:hypothetical protein
MKSEILNRGKLLVGLFVMLFTAHASAQVVEPTWVKEGVNWAQYDKFLVKPLNIDDVRIVRPPWAADDPRPWTMDLEGLEAIQAIFRDAMKDVLSADDGYPLVYVDGKDVLEVEVELLSIMPWLRPGGDEDLEGYEVKTLGSGEITARVELRDSTTRELLLMIEGDKAVGEKYKQFTAQNNVTNVDRMFRSFAQRLRNSMDRIHSE